MTLEELRELCAQAEMSEKQGNYEEAERHLVKVLDELETFALSADNAPNSSLTRAEAVRILGRISWRQGDYRKALEHLTEALPAIEWRMRLLS